MQWIELFFYQIHLDRNTTNQETSRDAMASKNIRIKAESSGKIFPTTLPFFITSSTRHFCQSLLKFKCSQNEFIAACDVFPVNDLSQYNLQLIWQQLITLMHLTIDRSLMISIQKFPESTVRAGRMSCHKSPSTTQMVLECMGMHCIWGCWPMVALCQLAESLAWQPQGAKPTTYRPTRLHRPTSTTCPQADITYDTWQVPTWHHLCSSICLECSHESFVNTSRIFFFTCVSISRNYHNQNSLSVGHTFIIQLCRRLWTVTERPCG